MFDWVICDSPAGIERGATLAMRFADAAVIVANSEVSSVRDSDRIIGLLDSKTVKVEKGESRSDGQRVDGFDHALHALPRWPVPQVRLSGFRCRRRIARRASLGRRFQPRRCRPACCPAGSRHRRCGCRPTPPRRPSCR
jgi:hypothetical protein